MERYARCSGGDNVGGGLLRGKPARQVAGELQPPLRRQSTGHTVRNRVLFSTFSLFSYYHYTRHVSCRVPRVPNTQQRTKVVDLYYHRREPRFG